MSNDFTCSKSQDYYDVPVIPKFICVIPTKSIPMSQLEAQTRRQILANSLVNKALIAEIRSDTHRNQVLGEPYYEMSAVAQSFLDELSEEDRDVIMLDQETRPYIVEICSTNSPCVRCTRSFHELKESGDLKKFNVVKTICQYLREINDEKT